MAWREHDQEDEPVIPPFPGTGSQIILALDALAAVGIKQPNLALAAVAAAGVIEGLRGVTAPTGGFVP